MKIKPWQAIGGAAVAAGAIAWWMSRPEGVTVPKVDEPFWSVKLRAKVQGRWASCRDIPCGAAAELRDLRRDHGVERVDGVDVPKAPPAVLAAVARRWTEWMQASGAVGDEFRLRREGVPAALRWAYEVTPMLEGLAAMRANWPALADLPVAAEFVRELVAMAVALDVEDTFQPANPDNRTYWDFAWQRATTGVGGVVVKAVMWPVYGPYLMVSTAWEYLPDAITPVLRDVLGPAAKFIVTTFGVVLVIGGVGYYVYRKWPGPKPRLPVGGGA